MRRGEFKPQGPLTLGDLLWMTTNLVRLGYKNDALVEVKTPMPPADRRAVTLIVVEVDTESLG